MAAHTSDINFKIALDDNKVPERITWSAADGGVEQSDTRAAMLSVWDHNTHELLKIDLWTKDMPLDQMKKFLHQNLAGLADTLERAAGMDGAAEELRQFALSFGEKHGILRKPH